MSDELAPAKIDLNHFIDLINKTNKDKPAAADRAEIDRILREHPAVWRIAGDVMSLVGDKLIHDMPSSYAVGQALRTGKHQLQNDLARPGDGELERLLIQQAVLAWLKLAYTEHHHRHYLMEGGTLKECDFWERRLSAAQRRFLRAIETLARVRRLQLPAVQVNIGAQQVNQVNTRG